MDFLMIISLGIAYLNIYSVVYFTYIHLKKRDDREATLFQPGISIIIPVYNEEKNIKQCIKSIIKQEYLGPIEILAMDDGSTDNSPSIIKKYRQVKYVKASPKGQPQGKTKIINQAIKLTKHEFVGILDSDSYLKKDALKQLIGEFENKEVGAAVPITKVHKPKNLLERLQMVEYTLSMCIRKIVSNTGSLFMTHGVGTLFRKKALEKIGLFKENTLTEDLNIGLKLIKEGYKIKSNFKAIGYTVVPSTTKHVIKQRLRWNGGLFENTYWFKDILFNKSYGNAGLFVLPLNLSWSIVTVFSVIMWVSNLIEVTYYDIRRLLVTNLDLQYFIINKIKSITTTNINELTIIGGISLIMFISFYYLMSRKINLTLKESLISYLLLPLYFTIFLLINAVAITLTPIYMIKKSGKPWLTDKKNIGVNK